MIKLVLTDLDATLIASQDNRVVSQRSLDAIATAIDAGVHVGPVTGRTPAGVAEAFPNNPQAYATGAFANGALVLLDGEVIHRAVTSPEALQRVADTLDDLGEGVLTIYDIEGDRGTWFVSGTPERIEPPSDHGAYITEVRPRVEEPALKANVHMKVSRERLVEVRDMLREQVPELDFVFPSATMPLIDILPAGYGKGDAVAVMADALGIGIDEVATFGDSENDLSMLEAVPNSVAVANATPDAARAARWHIGHADDYAVADALIDIAKATAAGEMPSFMR